MKLASYWLDTAAPFAAAAQHPPRGRYDVAIVGGGFTGLSAALALAKKGISAAVLEQGTVGCEASGRNGGHCNNGLAHDFGSICDRFGNERARELYRAFDAGVDLVGELTAEHRIDCDFVRNGKLKLAAKPAHVARMARSQELLAKEVDPETAFIEHRNLPGEIGATGYFGGLLHKRSASLHVGRFAVGLANAATQHGATIFEHAMVTAIARPAHARFSVTTRHGTIEADNVILATGTSQRGPFGWFRRRIIPIGSFIVVTEPLNDAMARSIMPGRRNCTTTQNIGFYFRMTADDRLVFGGRARFALSNPRSDRKSGAILERNMRAMFPQLARTRLDYCWGGVVDATRDRLPRCGEYEGMIYAMGFSGHGVQMSTLMGNIMARRLAGESVVNPWRDMAWPAVPGHFGPPWFLPAVGAYYRVMDYLR